MNTPEDAPEETIKGINAADLLARGLESAKAATGNPQAWQPPTPEELSKLLPQYEIESLLGRGGMGAVYRGKQAALDRAVAIKLLPAELAADAEFMSRFQREARTLAKLQHPGIVAVHDFGQTSQGHLYFVMEFVNGTDLSRLIHGPGVNAAQALEIITQVCEALQYAHSQGVIHRDIKPANVLINTEGRAKLADFGLARPTSEETASLTRSNVVMGTPDYMAPEQMAGTADHRADLYALGVMLYEMLTGQTPRGAWAPPSQRVQVDVRLDQVVVRALQQDPAMRYQQASEIKTDVDVIRTTPLPKAGKAKVKLAAEAPGQRTTPLPKAKKPGSMFAIAAAIILPLLAAAGMVAFYMVKKPTASSPQTPGEKAKLPWQRIDHSEAEWAKLGNTVENGWVNLLDIHKGKPVIVFDMLREERALSKFAVRARAMYHEDGNGYVGLSCRDNENATTGSIQFWRNHMTVRPQLAANSQRYPVPASVGDKCEFEAVFLEGKVHARFNGGPVFSFTQETSMPCVALTISGSKASVRDIEYVNLDGIADPLKALGWEVPVDASPAIAWTRVERTAEEWAKTGQTLKDGWVHNPDKNILVFDRLSAAKATSQFVVRTKVKFHETESNLTFVNQTAGGHAWRKMQFYSHKQIILNGDRPPAYMQRHVSNVELDEEALVEMLMAGDKVYTRFNGQPVVTGDLSPAIPWEQCYLTGGLNHSLRDLEYAILDGISDPLKSLGWEVAESEPAPSLPWQKLTQRSPNWDDKVLLVDGDGWIEFKTTEETPHQISLTEAAPSNNPGLFRDTALRVHYRWNPQQRRKAGLYLSARNRAESGRAETWLTGGGYALDVSGGDGVNWQRMLPQPLKLAEEGTFELGVIGQRMLVRLNGQVLLDKVSTVLNRTGSLKVRVQNCLLRDIEHVNLDGIADPLKALGWEVDASTVTNSGWKDFMAELESGPYANPQLKAVWQREAGGWRVAKHHTFTLPDDAGRDMSIRASGTGSLYVFARSNKEQSGYEGRLFKEGFAKIQKGEQVLKHVPLGSQFDPAKPHQIELRLSKNVLTLSLDGAEIISLEDRSLPPGGRFGVSGSEGALIEKVEYRFLDESSASQTQSMPDSKAAADAKKLLVEARAHLKAGDLAETRKLVETALTTAPGDLTTQAEAALMLGEAEAPERALSLANDFFRNTDAEHPQFTAITEARVKLMPKMREYRARLDAAAKLVTANDDAGELRELQAALKILPDGREAADRLEMNPLHVGRALPGRKSANELGHTFVPVDGLPNVLFSTWETRVKDFEQFVKETGHDMRGLEPYNADKTRTWQAPGFEQSGDHPVVLISRQDARDFCDWMTKKERASGRLLPGQVYRLPTDREWSAAMGVLNEPGDFPEDRQFPENVFTWPKGAPPPRNAENLNSSWNNDDFLNTAPVGSGTANQFGIYDLIGNVKEICADPWGLQGNHDAAAVLRGSSYNSELKVWRYRQDDVHAGRVRVGSVDVGFRCVLDLKTEEQRTIQTRMEEAVANLQTSPVTQNRPRREINTLVNDEMVLMDLRRWWPLNEAESTRLIGLPLTHLMAMTSERTGSLAVMKTFPLKVLFLNFEQMGEKPERFLENLKGLPLTNLHLAQHIDMGLPLHSIEVLAGAPLRELHLWNFKNLKSIEALRGKPMETVVFGGTNGTFDLSPLKEARLRQLGLPETLTLERFVQACDWWGGTVQTLNTNMPEVYGSILMNAALSGDTAKVDAAKSTVEGKVKSLPWLKTSWNKAEPRDIYQRAYEFWSRAARHIGGDAAAFEGQFKTFGGHSYLWFGQRLALDEATTFARQLGANVLSITSQAENDFIIEQIKAGVFQVNFMLGLERSGKGRTGWKWVSGEPFEFHNWGPESGADGTSASLVESDGRMVWYHNGKATARPFIIEWDTPTPQPPVKK